MAPEPDHLRGTHGDSDDDAVFAALENEDDTSYRDQRIQQLNAEFASNKTNRDAASRAAGATIDHQKTYPTLDSDQAVLDFTTETTRCIVHFAHPDFARCAVMDARMEELAGRHYDVRFARVDVRHTPFIAEKLSIRVLPCVIGFRDGVGVERIVGFEGLGARGLDGAEGFDVAVLEKRFLFKGVLVQAKFSTAEDAEDRHSDDSESDEGRRRPRGARKAIRSGTARLRNRDDDDDDDWD
ncbi:hypothetical protein NUU61_009643 [Penicillium alfredii]|uniref:Thioredoxin domain-containing protein n=1 Tax=Penicillium alfredii TaxID=1506179 RepID=A0A9W9EGK4_9EURO|nr:uncharacterized protein NUU61_009643 [Penicillium alfredii]KAJ5081379.1 hypothetical protein NUU61_009643 [Penicillium alfredii]